MGFIIDLRSSAVIVSAAWFTVRFEIIIFPIKGKLILPSSATF